MSRTEIINRKVVGVGFGFLGDEEIRELSVVKITNPYSLDHLKQPVRGGFYDRAMGPINNTDTCATCGLIEKDCPGHSGHIELAVPIYNVFLFDILYKLLNAKCFECHCLRNSVLDKKALEAQLLLLNAGYVEEAQRVAELYEGTLKKSDPETMKAMLEKTIRRAHKLIAKDAQPRMTTHAAKLRQDLIKTFLATKVNKCRHCDAAAPKLRRDGHTKIFLVNATPAMQAHVLEEDLRNALQKLKNQTENQMGDGEGKKSKDKDGKDAAKKDTKDSKSSSKKSKETKSSKKAASKRKAAIKAAKRRGHNSDDEDESGAEVDEFEESDDAVDNESDVENEESDDESSNSSDSDESAPLVRNVVEAGSRLLLPNEVEKHVKLLWAHDGALLSQMFAPPSRQLRADPKYNGSDYRMFFMHTLFVPPSRFRPPRFVNGQMFENDVNVSLRGVFETNERILSIVRKDAKGATTDTAEGSSARSALAKLWLELQQRVNVLLDSQRTGSALSSASGIGFRQILEKKEGLFRRNMMGKRVNFAARSVISPDPYLHTKEIGVPEIFARTLTYPQPVTAHNYEELRAAVINGPFVHPGANAVADGRGNVTSLEHLDLAQRTALANTLLSDSLFDNAGRRTTTDTLGQRNDMDTNTSVEKNLKSHLAGDAGPKVVYRHLKSGDVLIVNRQPTLHKPSMMTHVARVLKEESTIRMHYANCNSYNADFDGDEINLHFVQNELARAEAYDIANTDNQYIVPTSGNPLRGLIQDHIVAGVRLSRRDCFLNKETFQQFLYLALSDSGYNMPHRTPVPAILKPRPLWTGKQIFSALLDVITYPRPPMNLNPVRARVPGSSWGKQGEEDGTVIVRQNVLVQGVLDKAQFGPSKHGLVHAIYELYGSEAAGNFLTILSRLFTRTLQYDGFTCGLEDMVLLADAEDRRTDLIKSTLIKAVRAAAEVVHLENEDQSTLLDSNIVNVALQKFFRENKKAGEILDGAVKAAVHEATSQIIATCLPAGQRKPFPHNNLAMMTLSGAKGSMVNFSQIACLLGQQELEGRRVPVTIAGKTLPSFPKYDPQPRAGGWVSQRFMTGIQPQEYYFHCMAGREGLVDTAVKTSRSGYLQRCLMKHLESLSVKYDNTVRDVDGSVVQFYYGEDSIDVTKSSYLQNLTFLADNFPALMHKLDPVTAVSVLDCTSAEQYLADLQKQVQERQAQRAEEARKLEKETKKLKAAMQANNRDEVKTRYAKISKLLAEAREADLKLATADTVLSKFPPGSHLGAVSDKFLELVNSYADRDPDGLIALGERRAAELEKRIAELEDSVNAAMQQLQAVALAAVSKNEQERVRLVKQAEERAQAESMKLEKARQEAQALVSRDKFVYLMNLNYIRSLVAPGENVGVLAAQSIGEPSTQMTLNTFHLAGHGGANVTLGIPRLREIVMTASANIATPIMDIPVKPGCSPQHLAAKLNRVRLAECLKAIKVRQYSDCVGEEAVGSRIYDITFTFKDLKGAWAKANLIDMKQMIAAITISLMSKLGPMIRQKANRSGLEAAMMMKRSSAGEGRGSKKRGGEEDDDDMEVAALSAEDRFEQRMEEEGVAESRRVSKAVERASYDDDEEEDDESSSSESEDFEPQTKGKLKKEEIVSSDSDSSDDEEGGMKSLAPSPLSLDESAMTAGPSMSALENYAKRLWDQISNRFGFLRKITFDFENQRGATVRIVMPPSAPKLLMLSLVEKAAENALVRYTKNINRASVVNRTINGVTEQIVQTDGVNFTAVWQQPEADTSRIKSNDIAAILRTYGVEACRRAICDEISSVFAVYGIAVDPRHLQLIADHMTFEGGFTPMNRSGIASRPSPLQKASFETSMKFILDASLRGDTDLMTSPSSNIVFGLPMQGGSGCFDLMQPLPF